MKYLRLYTNYVYNKLVNILNSFCLPLFVCLCSCSRRPWCSTRGIQKNLQTSLRQPRPSSVWPAPKPPHSAHKLLGDHGTDEVLVWRPTGHLCCIKGSTEELHHRGTGWTTAVSNTYTLALNSLWVMCSSGSTACKPCLLWDGKCNQCLDYSVHIVWLAVCRKLDEDFESRVIPAGNGIHVLLEPSFQVGKQQPTNTHISEPHSSSCVEKYSKAMPGMVSWNVQLRADVAWLSLSNAL